MRCYKNSTITPVFKTILSELLHSPDFIASPRGQEVREIRDCSMEIENPMINLYKNEFRNSPTKYISAELLTYFSGTNRINFISKYAKMWNTLLNPDGITVNSMYGNLLFKEVNNYGLTQYKWVIESLKRDKDSRQAFMHFNKPHHQFFENKDQVCTLQALFHIRNNKLYMTLTMRSNDVILGFMTDWAFFSILHYHVFLHLKNYYSELELGSYTHISHSMHLYERNYELVENMLTKEFIEDSLPLINTPIINENGSFRAKYTTLFNSILDGELMPIKTDNDLLNYCIEKAK